MCKIEFYNCNSEKLDINSDLNMVKIKKLLPFVDANRLDVLSFDTLQTLLNDVFIDFEVCIIVFNDNITFTLTELLNALLNKVNDSKLLELYLILQNYLELDLLLYDIDTINYLHKNDSFIDVLEHLASNFNLKSRQYDKFYYYYDNYGFLNNVSINNIESIASTLIDHIIDAVPYANNIKFILSLITLNI